AQNGLGVGELQHDGTTHPQHRVPRRGGLVRGAAHEPIGLSSPRRPGSVLGRPPGDHVEDVRGRPEVLQGGAQPPQRVGGMAGGDVAALLPRRPPRPGVGVAPVPRPQAEARGAEREDVPRRVVERGEALDLAEGGVRRRGSSRVASGAEGGVEEDRWEFVGKEQIDKLLDKAGGSSDSARSLLAAALPHLESSSASHTGDAKGGLNLITLAEGELEDASIDLTGTVACLKAGILLILDLRNSLYSAASSLAASIARSEDALRAIDRCRGLLSAAKLLLGHPSVPGVDGFIEAERAAAVRALEAALGAIRGGGDVDDEADRRLARAVGLRDEVRRLQHRFTELHGAVELLGEAGALLLRRWPPAPSSPSCTRVASSAAFSSLSSAHHTAGSPARSSTESSGPLGQGASPRSARCRAAPMLAMARARPSSVEAPSSARCVSSAQGPSWRRRFRTS
uniref:Uncharacterized protein n=1 Tax=Setaria italica TaxID=4555 RepID=K3ZCB0_SETIT